MNLVIDGSLAQENFEFDPENFVKSLQQADLLSYLPGDILAKVDRASMAVSLEARVPFLDHRVVEFAMNLSSESKFKNYQTKWILRQVLERYVPCELTNQEKMGFGIPIDRWLRGSLRDWAENLLSEKALQTGGFLNAKPIRHKWQEHLAGRLNHQHALWGVLMFQTWREHWMA
jgi:asparagine synthase (glutamine-hydrolysing)